MTDFFRFPHTPHIAWLGAGMPRDDKVLAPHEVSDLLSSEVSIEEKLDGANLGISLSPDGRLRAQNRGQYLNEPFTGQFSRLGSWLAQHQFILHEHLDSNLILFGEWCAARHSLDYACLPDWFMAFDVYDREKQLFWSTERRGALLATLGIIPVPTLERGQFSPDDLTTVLSNSSSRYRAGPPEGIIIRKDIGDWCQARAKLVCADFTQTIAEHWRSRPLEWNRVVVDGEGCE